MSVKIFYNGSDFFGNNELPTPKISTSTSRVQMGENLGTNTTITLSGDIYIKNKEGCNLKNKLEEKRELLFNHFSNDFGIIRIEENNQIILDKNFCKVLSISFPDSNYTSVINYSIEIESYDEENYNSFFGVINPSKSISIDRLKNGDYEIKRSISATGKNLQDGTLSGSNINSLSSSLENAIDFVNSFDAQEDFNFYFNNNINYIKISTSENIDRFKNQYSVEEVYIATESEEVSSGILSYTIDQSKEFEGLNQFSISGNIIGGQNISFSDIQSSFNNLNILDIVESKTGYSNINKYQVTSDITELKDSNTIEFKYSFSHQDGADECGVKNIINFSIQKIADEIDLSISGRITSMGTRINRWNNVKKYFDSLNFEDWIYQKSQDKINEYETGKVLHTKELSKNINFNEENGEISFSVQFSTRHKIENFNNYNESVSIVLINNLYNVTTNFAGGNDRYIISNDGEGKGEINISLSAEYNDDQNKTKSQIEQDLKTRAETIKNEAISDFFSGCVSIMVSDSGSFEHYKNVISGSWTYNIYK